MELNYRQPANPNVMKFFLDNIDFILPPDFITFYAKSNGGDFNTKNRYFVLWELENLFERNIEFEVNEYLHGFFAFGTDGGNQMYCIKKATGDIYEIPFIVMSEEDALFVAKSIGKLF
jgi:hypothetical protein